MMTSENYFNQKIIPAIVADQGAGDDTAKVSAIADLANVTECILAIQTGTLADADATFTVLIEDGNDSGLSDNAAVADGFLLGTEALASFTFTNDDTAIKIGYIGEKRYVRATITPATNTGAWDIAAVWILGGSRKVPHTTQKNT